MYFSSTQEFVSISPFAKCNFLYDTCDVQHKMIIVPILNQAIVLFDSPHFVVYRLLYLITGELRKMKQNECKIKVFHKKRNVILKKRKKELIGIASLQINVCMLCL